MTTLPIRSSYNPVYGSKDVRHLPEVAVWHACDPEDSCSAWTDVLIDARCPGWTGADNSVTGPDQESVRGSVREFPSALTGWSVHTWLAPVSTGSAGPHPARVLRFTTPAGFRFAIAVSGDEDNDNSLGRFERFFPGMRWLFGSTANPYSDIAMSTFGHNPSATTFGYDPHTLAKAVENPAGWFATPRWQTLPTGVPRHFDTRQVLDGEVSPGRLLCVWASAGCTSWDQARPWAQAGMLPTEVSAWAEKIPDATDAEVRAWQTLLGSNSRARTFAGGWTRVGLDAETATRWLPPLGLVDSFISDAIGIEVRSGIAVYEKAGWEPERVFAVSQALRGHAEQPSRVPPYPMALADPAWARVAQEVAVEYAAAGFAASEALTAESEGRRPALETFAMLASLSDHHTPIA